MSPGRVRGMLILSAALLVHWDLRPRRFAQCRDELEEAASWQFGVRRQLPRCALARPQNGGERSVEAARMRFMWESLCKADLLLSCVAQLTRLLLCVLSVSAARVCSPLPLCSSLSLGQSALCFCCCKGRSVALLLRAAHPTAAVCSVCQCCESLLSALPLLLSLSFGQFVLQQKKRQRAAAARQITSLLCREAHLTAAVCAVCQRCASLLSSTPLIISLSLSVSLLYSRKSNSALLLQGRSVAVLCRAAHPTAAVCSVSFLCLILCAALLSNLLRRLVRAFLLRCAFEFLFFEFFMS